MTNIFEKTSSKNVNKTDDISQRWDSVAYNRRGNSSCFKIVIKYKRNATRYKRSFLINFPLILYSYKLSILLIIHKYYTERNFY